MRRIGIIGAGRIGGAVMAGIRELPDVELGRVLTASGRTGTADVDEFLSVPHDIIVETAGPAVLRALGIRLVEAAELWTVSASALADDAFRAEILACARRTGRTIRLFSDWIAAADHNWPAESGSLSLVAKRPNIGGTPGLLFTGGLREATRRFPDHVNSAVAAALCGPGLDRARIEIFDTGAGGEHSIEAVADTRYIRVVTRVEFPLDDSDGFHPTAGAILAALRRDGSALRLG